MKNIIVTNNSLVVKEQKLPCIYVEEDADQVLAKVRDLVHMGYLLLSHPLGASIKMIHSPVVSILMEEKTGPMDLESVEVIEGAILKLRAALGERTFDYRNRSDYEIVDRDRLLAAFQELKLNI
ncbi:MAG: GrdX family protein [Tissierellia bacterium]|nr:GrdX family protein [Tissierellia bacterium]